MSVTTTILQVLDGSGWLHETHGGYHEASGLMTITHERLIALALVERSDPSEEGGPWREVVGVQRAFMGGEDDFVDSADLVPVIVCRMDSDDERGECPSHDRYVPPLPKRPPG